MNWYIKEFSTLTKVSVRTLHHYDEITILKPSVRLSNGYRLYSEQDLLKLQQIVALKFFGFNLKQIKHILDQKLDVFEHLKKQKTSLLEQIKHFEQVGQMLDQLIVQAKDGKSFEWSRIIQLIGVYQMTKELTKKLDNQWMAKVFSPDQLKQFNEIGQKFSEEELDAHGKRWEQLMEKVNAHKHEDPASAIGQQLAKEWMDLLDEVYGDYPELKDAMSLAYKYNKIPNNPYDEKLYIFLQDAVRYMYMKMGKKKW